MNNEKEYCPLFIDYTRKCIAEIQMVSEVNTIKFCTKGIYKDCPFYRTVKKIGNTCKMINMCIIYEELSHRDFKEFLNIINNFCLCSNNVNCKRYQAKKRGETPPIDLMP